MKNRRAILLAVMLMLTIGNFSRIQGNENLRPIQMASLISIGAIGALFVRELIVRFKG